MEESKKNNLIVKGIDVNYKRVNQDDYICLTDIAKAKNQLFPADVVKKLALNQIYTRIFKIMGNAL